MAIAIRFQQPGKTSTSNFKPSLTPDSVQIIKRRVRFRDSVSEQPIKHIDDMSNEQVFNTWYGNFDLKDFKKDAQQTVRVLMMNHGDKAMIDNDEYCSRGLECRTREGASVRRANRWNALNAVFIEQDRQWNLGIRNEQLLCQIYVAENCRSRLNALTLGIQDEKAAIAIHSDQASG